jgi:pimeloyl-ACP methyl ester carboxylesterase
MNFFRAVLSILQPVWPGAAAWLAERLFFTAPRRPGSATARAALANAVRFTLRVDGRRVIGWRWGDRGRPVVYLIHGWGSRGSRMSAFVQPLLGAGYAVVTHDAPGHGASGWGMSSMPEFARTLAAVTAREGSGSTPHAVIAHSMGCAGTALALSWGLEVSRLVFLGPAADPVAWIPPFARALRLRPDVLNRMQARSERRLRFRWADVNVCDIARRLPNHPPLLIVHDNQDETVAARDGEAIAAAWPRAQLLRTEGLGHRGVTHDPSIVAQAVDFVTAGPLDSSRRMSDAQRLEHELFYREERVWSALSSPANSWSSGRPRSDTTQHV